MNAATPSPLDAVTRSEFEAQSLRPFTYTARGKTVTMSYFEAPPEIFEEPKAMRPGRQRRAPEL
ncbi:MAG: TfoX/Sxy family protein [Pseudomonadota bacterium]